MSSPKNHSAASIILRGANDFMLDEMERSIHDALCVVRRVLESKSLVAGGGAVEAALSIYLENYAHMLVSHNIVDGVGFNRCGVPETSTEELSNDMCNNRLLVNITFTLFKLASNCVEINTVPGLLTWLSSLCSVKGMPHTEWTCHLPFMLSLVIDGHHAACFVYVDLFRVTVTY